MPLPLSSMSLLIWNDVRNKVRQVFHIEKTAESSTNGSAPRCVQFLHWRVPKCAINEHAPCEAQKFIAEKIGAKEGSKWLGIIFSERSSRWHSKGWTWVRHLQPTKTIPSSGEDRKNLKPWQFSQEFPKKKRGSKMHQGAQQTFQKQKGWKINSTWWLGCSAVWIYIRGFTTENSGPTIPFIGLLWVNSKNHRFPNQQLPFPNLTESLWTLPWTSVFVESWGLWASSSTAAVDQTLRTVKTYDLGWSTVVMFRLHDWDGSLFEFWFNFHQFLCASSTRHIMYTSMGEMLWCQVMSLQRELVSFMFFFLRATFAS